MVVPWPDVDEDPIIEQRFFLDNSNLRRHIVKITSSRVAVALGAGVDEERVFLIVPHPVGLKYVPVLHIRKITLMDPTSWWFPGLRLMRIQSLSKDSFWTIVT